MNRPIKRVAIFCLALYAALFVNANYIQVVSASSYAAHSDNQRNLIYEFSDPRGQILVNNGTANVAIATSSATGQLYNYQRNYSNGPLYAQSTGYFSIDYGSSGIESYENGILEGNASSQALKRLENQLQGKPAGAGSVVLTLNPAAQQAAYNGLASVDGGKAQGAVVALDPKTGAILALVSAPSYDPNSLSTHDRSAASSAAVALSQNPAQPKLDRALDESYPPGSTFKIITSAAAMADGVNGSPVSETTLVNSPTQVLPLPGSTSTLSNDSGETCGNTTLKDAFTKSCNTVFGQLGLDLGGSQLQAEAQKWGFNQTGPRVPMPSAESVFPSGLTQAEAAQSAIGQYNVQMTPLQGAMMAAGVADGGVIMQPYLVKQQLDTDGSVLNTTQPTQLYNPITPDQAGQLKDMMVSVVTSGTGKSAQISGVQVAGKTGTAQRGPGQTALAWFVAFAPADNPQIAIAVLVQDDNPNGGDTYGGTLAAPIAKSVIEAVLNHK
ncbi:MAG TPA: penicillin-binding protein 2 [Actinocrinis sp.]|nr:penicillin-binding protein 2 [Actinocrinis sp.]